MTNAPAAKKPHMSKKLAFNLFLYASLLALAYALYRADYLRMPRVIEPGAIVAAFLLLFAGALNNAFAWRRSMALFGYAASMREAIAGVGLSIFGKYLPGKLWILLGRAAYSAKQPGRSFKKLSLISVRAQLVTIWAAMTLGAPALIGLAGQPRLGWLAVTLWTALTIVVFSRKANALFEWLIKLLLRRDQELLWLSAGDTLRLAPRFAITWLLWAAGFYAWCVGLVEAPLSWRVALAFPLTVALGIMALFAPGGLGVREGLLVLFFGLEGFSLTEATTLAVSARLWFLVGEFFAFACGLAAHRYRPRQDATTAGPANHSES